MRFHELDLIQDPRWGEFVERDPKASVFHTVGWLQALQRTYGYRPVVFTSCPSNAELKNGLEFCHIRSWLTGDPMVSLPFSDHCEPLFPFPSGPDVDFLIEYLRSEPQHRGWKYIQVRPVSDSICPKGEGIGFEPAYRYFLHRLDRRPDLDQLFRSFHRNSVQRRIRRAERAGVVLGMGRSVKLLKDFYQLLVLTRRRHRVPPQPYLWFHNLVDSMKETLDVRVAYHGQFPIAAILTLRFRNTVYYKYGCSDARFNHLAGMPFLLWKTIEESKMSGAEVFDLGRSDTDDEGKGLVSFKNHWVQRATNLVYWRYPVPQTRGSKTIQRLNKAKRLVGYMPRSLLVVTGRLINRHIG
jgi:hypothetical protein